MAQRLDRCWIAALRLIAENLGMDVKLNVCWALGHDDATVMDPLVFDLLEAVEQGCSLRSAATRCGSSYRHAWGLMREWEQRFGSPLLELERGRGARLSSVGRCLLWAQRRTNARLAPTLDSLSAEVEHELGELLARSSPLKMVASHDLALDLLRDRYNQQAEGLLNLQYRGSLDAVRQLVADHCDIAGYHIPEQGLHQGQIENSFSRLMPPEDYQSIHFVTRRQGLLLAKGLQVPMSDVSDLPGSGLRFLNRQRGSGTRLLFDQLIKNAGIESSDISGYDVEEFTHLAVAAMLASGAADVGFGVQAAAQRFGLDFVPMVKEHYFLAVRKASLGSEWCLALLKTLRDNQMLKDEIGRLPGYQCAQMGELASR